MNTRGVACKATPLDLLASVRQATALKFFFNFTAKLVLAVVSLEPSLILLEVVELDLLSH